MGLGRRGERRGDLDLGFNTTGFVRTHYLADDQAAAMVVQSDGKFIIVGSTSSADLSSLDFLVVRYNANGSLDTTFGTGGIASTGIGSGNDIAYGVAIQSDGKIVVAGETNDASATKSNFAVVRYTSTGALDTSFGTGGKITTGIGSINDYCTCVAVQSDGKIIVGGYTHTAADTTNFAMVRYTSTGALDTTFNSSGKVSTDMGGVDTAEVIVVQSTGKIILAGSTSNVATDYSYFALARYNANGSLDTTFNTSGKVTTNVGATYNMLDSIAVQPDGKIVAVGTLVEGGVGLARYNTTGALDATFNGNGKAVTALCGTGEFDSLHAVALQADGKILVAGTSREGEADDLVLARFNSNGSIDSGFGSNGRSLTNFSQDAFQDTAYGIAVLSDGSIMVAGDSVSTDSGFDLILAKFQGVGVALPMATVSTLPASEIAGTQATLSGSVNAKGISSTITFDYGTTATYGSSINATPNLLSTSTDTAITANLTGLLEGTTYHFRIKAVSANGTVEGVDRTFTTTSAPPPTITLHPRSVTAELGASFSISALGSGSGLSYQWQLNDIDVPGATSPTLAIPSFSSADSGVYTCNIRNSSGITATTDPAVVNLVTSLSNAFELSNAKWQTSDPAQWTVVTAGTHDGVDALISGSPAVGASSKISGVITGPTRLSYCYKLNSTANASFLRLYVDGSKVNEYTGSSDWTTVNVLLSAGTHQIEFSFDQVSAGAAGESASLDQLSLGDSSWISTPPSNKIVALGASTSLEVTTSGLPTSYQWRKNGVAMLGETKARLVFDSVATSDAQLYTLALGNGVVSSAATMTVVSGTRSSRQPLGKVATFTQTLTNGAGATFQWQRGGSNLTDGTKYAGTKSANLSVKALTSADAGADYTCLITVFGNSTPIGPYEVAILDKPVVIMPETQSAMVSGSFSLQLSADQNPTSWSATGLPPGITFNTKTGVFSGIANAANKITGPYTVTVTATNAAGVSEKSYVYIDISALPEGLVGTFNGLVDRSAALNSELGGNISVTVSATGSYTGTLRNGKDTHKLSGRIVADPIMGTYTGTQTISRVGTTPLALTLDFNPDQNLLTGSITSNGQTADLKADRKVWTSTLLATDYSGLFNNALELPEGAIGDGSVPQGTGYTQLSITTLGAVTITGRTADGIVITGSNCVSVDGSVPLFQLLYTNKGSLHGRKSIALDGSVASDNLTWLKTAATSTTDKTYPNRFEVALSTSGFRYLKPNTDKPIVFDLVDAADNAAIAFSSGGIENVTQFDWLDQAFRITKTNTTSFRTTTTGNPCNVKMTIAPTTGLFSGTVTLSDPGATKPIARTVNYYGLILPHRREGVGYFLLPALAPATAIQSGKVSLAAVLRR